MIEFVKGPYVFEIRAKDIRLGHLRQMGSPVCRREDPVMVIMALAAAFLFGIVVGSGLEILVRSGR